MFKIKNIAVVILIILSMVIVGCAKKIVTNKTVADYEKKELLEISQINMPEKTYETLFKETEAVEPEHIAEEIAVKVVNDPIAEVVQGVVVESCDEIGLVSEDMCEFCSSIDGAECRVIETIGDGQDCYSCVEMREVTKALEEKTIKKIPDNVSLANNSEKNSVIYKEIKEQPISDLEEEVDKSLDEVMEIADNYKIINTKVVKIEDLEEFEDVQDGEKNEEIEDIVKSEKAQGVDELASIEENDCTVFDLLTFADCTECDGNCVVEHLPEVEGACYRCEASTGGARCSDIGLKSDCSKCEDSSRCEFMELTVYLADGEKFEQSCYNCG